MNYTELITIRTVTSLSFHPPELFFNHLNFNTVSTDITCDVLMLSYAELHLILPLRKYCTLKKNNKKKTMLDTKFPRKFSLFLGKWQVWGGWRVQSLFQDKQKKRWNWFTVLSMLLVSIASDGQCRLLLTCFLERGSYTANQWGCKFMQQSSAGHVLSCSCSYVSSSTWSTHAFAVNLPNVPT